MADNEVKIILSVEGNAKKELDIVTKKMGKFGGVSKKAFDTASRAFASFAGNLASRAVSSAISTLSSQISAAGKNFLEFDKAVSEINTLLDKNEKVTKKTTQTFINFSNQFGGKATTQAKAFYQVISAGVSDTAEAIDLLEVANRAAVAGITDVNTAVDALTSVINSYGSDVIDSTEASDILFAAIKGGKTTFDELASTIGRVTPIAAAAGISFEEVAGSIAFLTSTGVSTDEAVTSLRATITSLIKPTSDQTKAANRLGIELNATALKSDGLEGILKKVKIATGGNIEEMGKLFPNVRALSAVTAIAGQRFDNFSQKLELTAKSAGFTQTAFDKVASSSSFQFEKLLANVENLGLEIAQKLAPVILEITTKANKFFETFGDEIVDESISAITSLVEIIKETIVVFTELQLGVVSAAGALQGAMIAIGVASDDVKKRFEDNASAAIELERRLIKFEDAESVFDPIILGLKKLTGAQVEANDVVGSSQKSILENLQAVGVEIDLLTEKQIVNSEVNTEIAEVVLPIKEQLTEAELALFDAANKRTDQVISSARTEIQIINDKRKQLGADLRKGLIDQEKFQEALRVLDDRRTAAEIRNGEKRLALEKKQSNLRLNAASKAFGDLAILSSSKNKTLANIGKSAAIAQTTIDTFRGAQAAFSALAGIPLIGPVLGAAAAAAAIVAGVARVASIRGTPLQTGITEVPGQRNVDGFPAILAGGERVISADQNSDLKDFLKEAEGTNEILLSIDNNITNLENQINVNVGGTNVVSASIQASRRGSRRIRGSLRGNIEDQD